MNSSKSRRPRKIQKWNSIIGELNIDVSKSVNYITAKQIKDISHEEPRLMSKMDRIENLPQVFLDNGLFLLPVSRSKYALVRGEGYHRPEPIESAVNIFSTSIPFPISASDVESESVYLEYANSCGLLSKLCKVNNLIPSFRGRRTTPVFSFRLGDSELTVEHAQIEVDAGFDAPNMLILFEAKINIPSSFSIRQLYYPFRTFGHKMPVRNFFFALEPTNKKYHFWEYDFSIPNEFESIKLVQSKSFQIKVTNPVSIKEYQKVFPDEHKLEIPQADDVNKIIQFPLRVFVGYDTSEKMTEAFGFVNRQSSYYRHAAQLIGLVTMDRNKYKLTESGEEFLKLPQEKKSSYVCKLLLEFKIINRIFLEISVDKSKIISRNDIIQILRQSSKITGSTLGRRAQTIISWFRWIRTNLGIVQVDRSGSISIARQMNLQ
jgi:hypothetical protein